MVRVVRGLVVGAVAVLLGVQNVKGDFLTADVAVYSPGGHYTLLQVGELVSNWDRYSWYDIPTFAKEQDVLIWQYQHTGYPTWEDGITTFEVLTNGPVLMACTTRWGGGGNSDGDWEEELTTREELEAQGWSEFATGLQKIEAGLSEPGIDYIVFRRDSVVGEVFIYRTEKYCPPLIIQSVTTIPEPSVFVNCFLFGLLGLTLGRRRRD